MWKYGIERSLGKDSWPHMHKTQTKIKKKEWEIFVLCSIELNINYHIDIWTIAGFILLLNLSDNCFAIISVNRPESIEEQRQISKLFWPETIDKTGSLVFEYYRNIHIIHL